jgi:hypothetical protein
MTIAIIAFSADVAPLKKNQLFESEVVMHYPGSSLASYVKKNSPPGIKFMTADVALDLIKHHQLNPKSVAVIQHNLDPECLELIELGSFPLLLTMYESPLYAGRFYDNLLEVSNKFRHAMLFGGSLLGKSGIKQAYFPCFSKQDLSSQTQELDWVKRAFASMVVDNKYVLTKSISSMRGLDDLLWWLAKSIRKHTSGFLLANNLDNSKLQLQDKRLEIIEVMLDKKILDLYGRGWDKLYRIPPSNKKKLSTLIPKAGVQGISHAKKRECLSGYKFNICFENFLYPGYVTEKIIDAILAKTIPVYWGAPDIRLYVPSDVFIDASKFQSMKDLVSYLLEMDEEQAGLIIQNGQRFLATSAGLRFSYESIAKEINDIIQEHIDL